MIKLLSAPSNLGLRPPVPGGVPGAAKAPEALRAAGLYERFPGAADAGVVLPGRYLDDDTSRGPGRLRNQATLLDHARRLADRLGSIMAAGDVPLVVGGDCSIVVGIGVGLARRGRFGLIHLDGHTDFRHPGNSDNCASLAGEDLAAAVGRHWPAIADLDDLGPYFPPERAVQLGHRDDDAHTAEARSALGLVVSAQEAIRQGSTMIAAAARQVAGPAYWLHLDVDVLDPTIMPAVDSPDPGGLSAEALVDLLAELAPRAIGASVTVFDPDLDPDGRYARLLTELLGAGLQRLGADHGAAAAPN